MIELELNLLHVPQDQDPERFESFKSMKDIFTERKDDKVVIDYMNSLMERAKATLNSDTDADVICKFSSMFQNDAMNMMVTMVDGKLSEPYSVVCHGDCWNNNLLFKYDVSLCGI